MDDIGDGSTDVDVVNGMDTGEDDADDEEEAAAIWPIIGDALWYEPLLVFVNWALALIFCRMAGLMFDEIMSGV